MLKTGPYLIATLLVKNEEDILEHSLKHHIEEQNIQFIIATDNNSTDNTKKILKSFKEVKIIIDENGSDHDQSKWVTRMAKLATIYDPKWIVHLDADEFWCNKTY
jgi:glycosyltransferase involved in cell wall biosynthesis